MSDDASCESILDDASHAAHALGIRGFHALWSGEAPSVASLCDDASIVERLVAAGRLEIDDAGRLVGVHGLVARLTPHRIVHDRGAVNTWCAFDAIGIPAALGIDAVAETSCPTCGRQLHTVLLRGAVVEDVGAQLWLPTADCSNLVEDFCSHANLYCDREHLRATADADRPGTILSVVEAAELGRRTWRDVGAREAR